MNAPPIDIEAKSEPAHPLARHLWASLRGRSEADRRLVLEALRRRIDPRTATPNQAIAAAALQRFEIARSEARRGAPDAPSTPAWMQGPPSRRRYNTFRSGKSDPAGWPSSQFISNAFSGNWTSALQAAGLAVAPDVLARRRTRRPGSFTKPELYDIVLAWVREVDSHTPDRCLESTRFYGWMTQQSRSPTPGFERFPSRPTLIKYLGSWIDILNALSLAHRHPMMPGVRRKAEAAEGWVKDAVSSLDLSAVGGRTSVGGPNRGYREEELLAWVAWLTAKMSEERRTALEMRQWDRLRPCLLLRMVEEKRRLVTVPSAAKICAHPHIGSWPQAKVRAGICPPEPAVVKRRRPRWDDARLETVMINAARSLGHLPSGSEYRAYRSKTLAQLRESDPWASLPSKDTIKLRLGLPSQTWADALATLRSRHPELAELRQAQAAGVDEQGQLE